MSSAKLRRAPDETELQYIYRIGQLKDDGIIDETWTELADIFNEELREPGEEYSESAYRKKYAAMKSFKEDFGTPATGNEDEIAELKTLKRELEKEKVKVRDERNEYRRLIREEARKESYLDQITRAVIEAAGATALEYTGPYYHSKLKYSSDLIISLTDLHCGLTANNYWNKFDENVLKSRLKEYLERIFEIRKRHDSENAYVCITEILSGFIHPALRIENNQDLINQFLIAINYVTDFLVELSKKFVKVLVYVAPGNHSRMTAKKDQSLSHENLDNLIIPFLKAKLQNYENIICNQNAIDHQFAVFKVRKSLVVFVHGDKDTPSTVVENMVNMLGDKPNICLMGHRHTNELHTEGDVKIIQSGCLSGTDEYAINIRKHNKPEQAVCVITADNGLDCIYDVKF